jgi:glycerophosphoryl diester phosphodiesterase
VIPLIVVGQALIDLGFRALAEGATMRTMTMVIAHRGASRQERENTIAAFERAAALGADGVELDVRRTIDGVLVVHHDAYLPDGVAICRTPYSDLPASVPMLGAALDACDGMFVNLEIKNSRDEPDHDPDDRVAEEVATVLVARGGGRRWLISSFRYRTVERFRELVPTARTAWLTLTLDGEVIERAAAGGHDAVHPDVRSVEASGVRRAHAAGLAVNVWTCNDPERMRELIAWGVDGICTDCPDVAIGVRRELLAR